MTLKIWTAFRLKITIHWPTTCCDSFEFPFQNLLRLGQRHSLRFIEHWCSLFFSFFVLNSTRHNTDTLNSTCFSFVYYHDLIKNRQFDLNTIPRRSVRDKINPSLFFLRTKKKEGLYVAAVTHNRQIPPVSMLYVSLSNKHRRTHLK